MSARQRAVRKPHNKSRLGCQTCKRRKVKCDEVRPACGNCTRFGTCCDFSPITPQAIRESVEAPASSSRRRRGRPRSDWASWAEGLRLSSFETSPHSETLNSVDVDDIELFHNWTTGTAKSLGDEDTDNDNGHGLWREGAVRLGFQHPCILNLMLALSSYQLARLRPSDAAKFIALGEQHTTAALQEAKVFIQRLEPENSPALYILSVLVCFTALAQGPSPGNLLLVAEDGRVSWLSLLRGVRLVVSTTGWSSIFSGPLAPYFPSPAAESESESASAPGSERKQKPEPDQDHTETSTDESPASTSTPSACGIEDWRSSLNDISNLIDVCGEHSLRAAYKHELEALTRAYEATFGNGEHASSRPDVNGEMQTIMGWMYQLEDAFVEGLSKKDPIALIILGHFCVLLHSLRRFWFIQGWASHVINEIVQTSEASRKWLLWPTGYLRGQSMTGTPAGASSPTVPVAGSAVPYPQPGH